VRDASPNEPLSERVVRFEGSIDYLVAAQLFNTERPHARVRLYIAQCPITDLSPELQADLPTPDMVFHSGRGDIYASSIWLGTEPTYTPWHRDPNPNHFQQLCSEKTVRLMPPGAGEMLFHQAQDRAHVRTSARIRGMEMMNGPDRQALHDAVWGPEALGDIHVAHLMPGDVLFIPKGWWHSIKSVFDDGGLNASVNWWFR